MSLRHKAMIMILVVFAVGLAITFVVSQTILTKRFDSLERENTNQNTQRAVSALYKDFSSINITFGPEAFDSESFSWVQDDQGMHLEIGMDAASFSVLNINYVAFVTTSGQLLAGLGYDLQTGEPASLPVGFAGEIVRGDNPLSVSPQVDSSSVTGILLLPETALLVQSFPVNVDTIYGPIQGRTILVRLLDDNEMGRLAQQTHLSLALYRWDDSDMPADFVAVQSQLSDEEPVVSQPLSNDAVAGYGLLEDVYGDPAMIMRAEMPRGIYHQGQQTVYWLIAYLALSVGLFAFVAMILINRVILNRLLNLSKGVDRVRETGNLSERVAVQGNDELSRLGGTINGMLGSLEEKEAEKQALLNAIPDLMFRVAEDGAILNARASERGSPATAGIGAARSTAYQRSPLYEALSAEISRHGMALVTKALQTRETQVFEVQVPRNGDTAYYEGRVAASSKNEALVMMRDITEKKHEEEARRRGLLLKEIHHRVKNNLQVVSSLLSLQSTRVGDKNVVEMFRESSSRVQSMSLIHQKLYQSQDAESIDFTGYVHDLTKILLHSYGVDQSAVKTKLDVDIASLGIDSALPCGLIINELLSNSLKHGFPSGRRGEVRISMSRDEGKVVKLVVADTGVGLPGDLDPENTQSLGLQLVVNLVEQLRGTIRFNREAGTEFTITFTEARVVSPMDRKQEVCESSVSSPS